MKDLYAAYMLRLWRVGEGDDAIWRASLEDSHTGELHGFADRKALFAFLADLKPRQATHKVGSGDLAVDPDSE